MSLGEKIYLGFVIFAFTAFGLSLAYGVWRSSGRKP